MNLKSSIKSPRLKMLDDCVYSIDMSLSLNKFPLSLLTYQNLVKLLLKLYTMQAPNKDHFKEVYSQITSILIYHRILLYDSYIMLFIKRYLL